jgi:NTE family protein
LEESGLRPDCIAGTSSGALVAALYAAGLSVTEIERLADQARWRDLVRPTVPRRGLVDTSRVYELLARTIGHRSFADLELELAVLACDITSGEEVVITTGDVAAAVQASCAVPGIFAPVRLGGRLLVDGGIVQNVPAEVCRQLGAVVVVAVDLSTFSPAAHEPRSIFEVILNTLQIIVSKQAEYETRNADVVIRPPLADLSFIDLELAPEFIARGYESARRSLKQLHSLLE